MNTDTASLIKTALYLAGIVFGSPIAFFAGWLFTGSFLIGVITGTATVALLAAGMFRTRRRDQPLDVQPAPNSRGVPGGALGHHQRHNPWQQ